MVFSMHNQDRMNRLFLMVLLSGIFLNAAAQQKLLGFTEQNAAVELSLEKEFDAKLRAADQDAWMKFLSSKPHHVGSAQGKANADYMANLFRQWGYETEIAVYHVLFPTPKTRLLELQGPEPYQAKLEEPALKEDRTSGQKTEQLPPYNAFSADGDVTAELVFVNRGIPADYEELEKMGVSVKGKIVIAKYGGSWRGIKPKVAAEHGAAACIIYSDPEDDGFRAGDVYPKGPFRPEFGVQRGSVMDMPVYPGDPLTPSYGSLKDAKRLDRKEAVTIMKIPVIPISYQDALPLLRSLGGQVVPDSWKGGLPITYHTGPSTAKARLKLEFNWDIKPLYNVIAKMKGRDLPDEWVIRGNHHDAWVNGAADPLSGMVAVMQEAKVIGELAAKGQQPKRTVVFCAWDGEEPSLLGSTEWVEDHKAELQEKAVAYINTDGNSRGFIYAGGSHTFEPFFNEIAAAVEDPQTKVSILERRYARSLADADATARAKMLGNKNMNLSALGSGSDYSPFLQHLGIVSFNLGFGGEGPGGEYHSIYDSYDHFVRFKDPGFSYGVTLAKTAGRALLRLANADIIPVDFSSFHRTVSAYATEVKTLIDHMRSETETENRLVRDNIFELARDPQKVYATPVMREPVPHLDFSMLENALDAMQAAADKFKASFPKGYQLSPDRLKTLNGVLYKAERALTTEAGLPRRPWYRHQVYAPGYYTGYGVKTLPGIREGIEERNWKEAQQQINILAETFTRYTAGINQAISIVQ
jgi:N-acetylated-alpha-linked acidic dipeptidase